MKYLFSVLFFIGLFLTGHAQTKEFTTEKYYPVGNTGIMARFGNTPDVSKPVESEALKNYEYRYAYPGFKDDVNLLYAVSVYEIKNDTLTDPIRKINYIASLTKSYYETNAKGEQISEKLVDFKTLKAIKQKYKIYAPFLKKDMYVTSVFFNYKNLVIRCYVFTPLENDNNKKTEQFFDTIKL